MTLDEIKASLQPLFPGQTLEYVLNWGGFVNCSFRIGDRLHLKLGGPEQQSGLLRWRQWAEHLSREYRAPRMLDGPPLAPPISRSPL